MKDKTVLVTGASSGIGQTVVLNLLSQGFSVIASVRSEKDRGTLSDIVGNLPDSKSCFSSIYLDVAD